MLVIEAIATANDVSHSKDLFQRYSKKLGDYVFIFGADKGFESGLSKNLDFSSGGAIRSLFNKPKLLVLNQVALKDMASKGKVDFAIDYSIGLDTQALSYLEPYFNGRVKRLPRDFKEVFDFIIKPNVNVDPSPYQDENLVRLHLKYDAKKIFNKIRGYELFKTIDINRYHKNNVIVSKCTDKELDKRTQEFMSHLYMLLDNKYYVEGLTRQFYYNYWHILAMVYINLNYQQTDWQSKLKRFLHYAEDELATLGHREIYIAREYFIKGQNLKFFSKIQKKKNDIFEIMTGMAWDFYHARKMEEKITETPEKHSDLFFPAILTFDKGFIEILDLYPLKSIAFSKSGAKPIPFRSGGWLEKIAPENELREYIQNTFMTEEAVIRRRQLRNNSVTIIKNKIRHLELKLETLLLVKKNKT
jgi:hypothetical protein